MQTYQANHHRSGENTVTIDKEYFGVLFSRALPGTNGYVGEAGPSTTYVSIRQVEHEYLLRVAREYQLLRNFVLRGGLTREALTTIIAFEGSSIDFGYDHSESSQTSTSVDTDLANLTLDDSSEADSQDWTEDPFQGKYNANHNNSSEAFKAKRRLEMHTTMSSLGSYGAVYIRLLPEQTTYKELLDVIQGGRVLDVYIRSEHNTGIVRLMEGAREFLEYARTKGVYIRNTKVQVDWYDRPYYITPYVARQMAGGATRNLVIKNAGHRFTEQTIRDDLDHIDGMVVVGTTDKDGNVYISTGSVRTALWARSCMLSRAAYKGYQIDFYPDECATPLPLQARKKRHHQYVNQSRKLARNMHVNRFAVLDTEDASNMSDWAQ